MLLVEIFVKQVCVLFLLDKSVVDDGYVSGAVYAQDDELSELMVQVFGVDFTSCIENLGI